MVHADRVPSMTSKSVAMLLDDLLVTRSHSRQRVFNDNPELTTPGRVGWALGYAAVYQRFAEGDPGLPSWPPTRIQPSRRAGPRRPVIDAGHRRVGHPRRHRNSTVVGVAMPRFGPRSPSDYL